VMQQSFVFVPHSILFIGLLNNGQQGVVCVSLSCAIWGNSVAFLFNNHCWLSSL